jgi:hypothetical protein
MPKSREIRSSGYSEALFRRFLKGNERKVTPMTSGSPNAIESKLDRLIDDMLFLRAQVMLPQTTGVGLR